jgi:WD40 repeat protein
MIDGGGEDDAEARPKPTGRGPGRPTRTSRDPEVSPAVRQLVEHLDGLIRAAHGSRTKLLTYAGEVDPGSHLAGMTNQKLSKLLRGREPHAQGPDWLTVLAIVHWSVPADVHRDRQLRAVTGATPETVSRPWSPDDAPSSAEEARELEIVAGLWCAARGLQRPPRIYRGKVIIPTRFAEVDPAEENVDGRDLAQRVELLTAKLRGARAELKHAGREVGDWMERAALAEDRSAVLAEERDAARAEVVRLTEQQERFVTANADIAGELFAEQMVSSDLRRQVEGLNVGLAGLLANHVPEETARAMVAAVMASTRPAALDDGNTGGRAGRDRAEPEPALAVSGAYREPPGRPARGKPGPGHAIALPRRPSFPPVVSPRARRWFFVLVALLALLAVAAAALAFHVVAPPGLTAGSLAFARSGLAVGDGEISSVAFAPDRPTLATAGAESGVTLWSVATPSRPSRLCDVSAPTGSAMTVGFGADPDVLAVGGTDYRLRLWELGGSPCPRPAAVIAFSGEVGYPTDVAFSPRGSVLAIATSEGAVALWDISGLTAPIRLSQFDVDPGSPVASVAYSPDGRMLVTAGFDGIARLWDVSGPHPVARAALTVGGGPADSVAFSPDGRTLAAGGIGGVVRLWDVSRARPRARALLTSPAASVAFSPDGRVLATAGVDGVARLWDVTASRPITQFALPTGSGPAESLAFSSDGDVLAVGTAAGGARLLRPARA